MANTWGRPSAKLVARRYRLKLKREVLEAYGGKCACCGESHLAFLTIDHRNGGGTQHRLAIDTGRRIGGVRFYQLVRKLGFPPEYECLCWNCNCGRSINGGVCPHKLSQ